MSTSETPLSHIFVYGTLLSASKKPMAQYVRQHSQLVGPGFSPGRLYDLGTYPGAVFDPDAETWVHGEVYSFRETGAPAFLRTLDDYEGAEYDRILVSVKTANGTVDCWTYRFIQPAQSLPLIASGRYFG
ncbi:gamma-glutamylcyclotransferase [Larkinella bovis]|uniref:Gamma-glutamylcyclotransferase n=1 Tax=Larkinella bovis TaxID=683041 RepID=A0ABW0IGA6_9BACT